ncbi:hypothetical protein HYU93_02410 [Candidatus Daviesbacteria bacterium]|nr:hypothetical protein [Candidatus Daviesbacteria bacterium]
MKELYPLEPTQVPCLQETTVNAPVTETNVTNYPSFRIKLLFPSAYSGSTDQPVPNSIFAAIFYSPLSYFLTKKPLLNY